MHGNLQNANMRTTTHVKYRPIGYCADTTFYVWATRDFMVDHIGYVDEYLI